MGQLSGALRRGLLLAAGRRARRRMRRGAPLQVRVLVDPELRTIDTWPLEDYVAGVVVAECLPHWPDAAVRSVAIAARSYVLWLMARPTHLRYDVAAGAGAQFFAPTAVDSAAVERLAEAVGRVLVDPAAAGEPDMPAEALYHNTCGGGTDTTTSVWGGARPGSHRSVECGACAADRDTWVATFSPEVLGALVGLEPGPPPLLVDVLARTDTGRSTEVELVKGSQRTVLRLEALRRRVGPDRLKSGRFEVSVGPTVVRFEGTGHGHGVGLCKRGAVALGEQGWSHEAILRHYYPAFELVGPR